jgi:nucleoside-diphosphate-sugar epimerase
VKTKPDTLKNNPLAEDLEIILDHTKDLWEELSGKQIFITGGTGFFGCWLLESFAWANDKLGLNASALVLTRNAEAIKKKAPHLAAHPNIRFHIGDVNNFPFPEGKFSHIIHAAASPNIRLDNEDPLLMFDTIVGGTRHILDFAAHCRTTKLLLTSSGAVYGRQPADMRHIEENYCGAPDPVDPASVYGEAKRAAEHLCTLYSRECGMETKIARCFTFYGPHLPLDSGYAIGNFIRDGLQGGPILVEGDGTPYRSYLYAADLAVWLWTLLFKGKSCLAYNVGSEEDLTIAALASKVARCFEKSPSVKIAGIPIAGQSVSRYVPSTKRVREQYGLRQTIDLEDGIKRTILFHRHDS